MNRGEIWLADLGYLGKVRPVLILSVIPGDNDRALVSYVIRTTSIRGTAYEVPHMARGMKPAYSMRRESAPRISTASSVALQMSMRPPSRGLKNG